MNLKRRNRQPRRSSARTGKRRPERQVRLGNKHNDGASRIRAPLSFLILICICATSEISGLKQDVVENSRRSHSAQREGGSSSSSGSSPSSSPDSRHGKACNFINSALKSFARVARRGATTFSDFYDPASGTSVSLSSRGSSTQNSAANSGKRRLKPNSYPKEIPTTSSMKSARFSKNSSPRQPQSQWQLNLDRLLQKQQQQQQQSGRTAATSNSWLNRWSTPQKQEPFKNINRMQQSITKQFSFDNGNHNQNENNKKFNESTPRKQQQQQHPHQQQHQLEQQEQSSQPPPNHFFEETLAYIAGGAAASSAFAAITAGALFATSVVAVGALMSALLTDEGEAEEYYTEEWITDEIWKEGMTQQQKNGEDYTNDNDDCNFDEMEIGTMIQQRDVKDFQPSFEKRLSPHDGDVNLSLIQGNTFLNELTMQELKKCFYGKPMLDDDFANVTIFPLSSNDQNGENNDVCWAEEVDDDSGKRIVEKSSSSSSSSSSETLEIIPSSIDPNPGIASKKSTCRIPPPSSQSHHQSHQTHQTQQSIDKMKEEDPLEPIRKRVEVVWHDAYGSAANAYYYTKGTSTAAEGDSMGFNKRRMKQRQRQNDNNNQRQRLWRSSSKFLSIPQGANTNDEENDVNNHWAIYTDAERDGALLLSESFRVASSTFGLVADAVRFTGETAAVTAGGSARILGGVVRVGGWAVESLGTAIERAGSGSEANDDGDDDDDEEAKILSNGAAVASGTRSKESIRSNNIIISKNKRNDKVARNTRKIGKIAGSSVQLVGGAIGQVSDALLLAGSAAERVAFAAAGAAEGAVRIVEDLTSSLSDIFAREGNLGIHPGKNTPPSIGGLDDNLKKLASSPPDDDVATPLDAVDEMGDTASNSAEEMTSEIDEVLDDGTITDFVQFLSLLMTQNAEFVTQEPELLGVLLICYMFSIILFRSKTNGLKLEKDVPDKVHAVKTNHPAKSEDDDSHSTLTIDSTVEKDPEIHNHSQVQRSKAPPVSFIRRLFNFVLFLGLLPFRLSRLSLVFCRRLILSRQLLLLVIYLSGWTFLCRLFQHRALMIRRKSEVLGYKAALDSLGRTTPSIPESAAWLNTILAQIWSFKHGGLGHLLSLRARDSLISLLKDSNKPSGVAYVNLESFTFGTIPPVVRSIEIKGVNDEDATLHLGVECDLSFEDSLLMLDIRPSSLEYKSLPTTRISINSLDTQVSLDVFVTSVPDYPYITKIYLSLSEIPDVNLRIVPQNESGFKGVDFGSFPVVSKWIKDVINSSLADYLSPQYLSINISNWLLGEGDILMYTK